MKTVSISAHKGGGEDKAEPATYAAYELALSSGAEYAEFDIRRTRDGVLVAYHDARAAHTGPAVGELISLCGTLRQAELRRPESRRCHAASRG